MPQTTLDYLSPAQTPPTTGDRDIRPLTFRAVLFALPILAIVLVVNYSLVGLAADDKSWSALKIMIMTGPIANAAICPVSFALTPLVLRYSGGSLVPHVLASLSPVAAIFVDGLFILSMGLHGC